MAPRWRQLFDTWEKAVAPGLEDLTASSEFRQAMGSATKLNAAFSRQFEEASRQWLHALNLPTATDVRRLRRQIASLEDEVGALRRAIRTTPTAADLIATNGSDKPSENTSAKTSTKTATTTSGKSATKTAAKTTKPRRANAKKEQR